MALGPPPTTPRSLKEVTYNVLTIWVRWFAVLYRTVIATSTQTGTQSITTGTALGALFSGTAIVTFTTPFQSPPAVSCNANLGGGGGTGFSAFATNVTKTGFTYNLVGTSNSTTTGNTWTATGTATV